MECRGHHSSLPHQYGIVVIFRQDFDAFANSFDSRRANEHHLQRLAAERGGGFDNCGIDLASVAVAANRDIEGVQAGLMGILDLLRQQYGPGTGTEGRLAVHKIVQLLKALLAQQLQKGTGLASWNNQAVDLIELLRLADKYNLRAQFFQAAAMRIEIALQCENTDFHNPSFQLSAVSPQLKISRSAPTATLDASK